MNLLSTDNSFYRYNISNSQDLSESCFNRRQSKAQYNNKKAFFFNIESKLDDPALAVDFLSSHLKEKDVLCCSIDTHKILYKSVEKTRYVLLIRTASELPFLLEHHETINNVLLIPTSKSDLDSFVELHKTLENKINIFWRFLPFNENTPQSLTVKDICSTQIDYKTILGLEIYNPNIPQHYELVPQSNTSYKVNWKTQSKSPEKIRISVIIPTFNNSIFLSNVVWHLINQNISQDLYEIIIADDGSTDNSSEILFNLYHKAFEGHVNITYIHWSKQHPQRGEQNFFRPGLCRNLAAHYSKGIYLFFLDSDMLVPNNFIEVCLNEFAKTDVIQFQRFHIHQEKSLQNPSYKDIKIEKDTYIEEKSYWSQLFFCRNWSDLPDYWKYTCTYALGIEKKKFYDLGLFKKYYISYGFEDTDLGYEAFKKQFKFSLVKIPLLHLTAYDLMQYKNSASKRYTLLKVTAELFFLQHLRPELLTLFGSFYRSQRSLKFRIKELLR